MITSWSTNIDVKILQKLAILDINELSQEIKSDIKRCNASADVVSIKCDIANKSNLSDVICNKVYTKFGYIDLLVNSVAILDERDPDRMIAINLVRNRITRKIFS